MTMMVVFGFIASGILFSVLYQPPSCDDGVQNGRETGVDCGGECSLCHEEPKKLFDVWARSFLVTEGAYAAVAYVENQNKDLYVPEVQFEIELYDKDNVFIERASENTAIMPNGVTPVFVPHILTGNREAATASFRFTEEPKFVPVEQPWNVSITDIYIETPEDDPAYVRASAMNAGDKVIKEADFVIILYDEEDVAVAASRTYEKNILPEEARILQFSWVHPIALRKGTCPGGLCPKQIRRVEIVPIVLK